MIDCVLPECSRFRWRIRVPATVLTGDASDPLYRSIAEALVVRIPGGQHVHLRGMTHAAPIIDPAPIAEAVTAALAAAGVIRRGPSHNATEESPP